MDPLRSIFLLYVSNKIRLNMGLFRPFYPKIGRIGWAGPDSTRRYVYLDHILKNLKRKYYQIYKWWETASVGITVDWCVLCKLNEIMALDIIRMLDLFQRKQLLQCEVTLITKMMKYTNS